MVCTCSKCWARGLEQSLIVGNWRAGSFFQQLDQSRLVLRIDPPEPCHVVAHAGLSFVAEVVEVELDAPVRQDGGSGRGAFVRKRVLSLALRSLLPGSGASM